MVSGISASLTALSAYGKKLQNNGNNVANMNTEEFKRGRVLLKEMQPQGVQAIYEKVETPGPQIPVETSTGTEMIEQSNVDLGQEMTDMIINQRGFEANLNSLRAADEMEQSVLDIKA